MPTNENYQYSLLTFIGWHGNDKEDQFLLEFFIVSSSFIRFQKKSAYQLMLISPTPGILCFLECLLFFRKHEHGNQY